MTIFLPCYVSIEKRDLVILEIGKEKHVINQLLLKTILSYFSGIF